MNDNGKTTKLKTWMEEVKCRWANAVHWSLTVDRVLRQGTEGNGKTTFLPASRVASLVVVFGTVYGLAMGSYAWFSGHRSLFEQLPQMIYSGVKVPLLVAFTVAISLPSFFVINTLFGLRNDFISVFRAIVSAQAGLAIILFSFFPVVLFCYASLPPEANGYRIAVLLNAFMFGTSSVAAQMLLGRYYRPLVERNPRHRLMIRVWIFVYAFVGIQAGFVLRPFIGRTSEPPAFFRDEPFQNAYVRVFEIVVRAVNGLV